MSDQSEALRLADALDARVIPRWVHSTGQTFKQSGYKADAECAQAAALLRRQHAEIESAHQAQREAENELSRALARHAMAESALKAERDALRDTLWKIARGNAMDYEYQAWARSALAAAKEAGK